LANKGTQVKTTQLKKNPLKSLVERGFAIHQQLLVLNEEFKKIKDHLKAEAETHPNEHVPLLEKDSIGDQWVMTAEGCECRIVFPGPQLKPYLDPLQPPYLTVKDLTGDHFSTLFRKVTTYEARDKKAFRGQVTNLLGPEAAAPVIEACSVPSEPKALWKARPTEKAKP
jgi:ligand-binding sensor domain-containing protein